MPKSSNVSPARLPKDALKKLNIGQSFAEYDIIRDKAAVVVDTPAMRSALDRDRSKCFFIGRRGTGKTAITFQVANTFRGRVPRRSGLCGIPLHKAHGSSSCRHSAD